MPNKKKKTEKPLTYSEFNKGLIKFYTDILEPQVSQKIDILDNKLEKFQNDVNRSFDFLFKKFEDLRQEYIVINHQMKRFDTNDEKLMKDVAELKSKVAHLQEQVEGLEQKLLSQ